MRLLPAALRVYDESRILVAHLSHLAMPLSEEVRQEKRKEAPQAYKDRKLQSCYIEKKLPVLKFSD